MWKPVIAIALGAALGALLRWWFGLRLNSMLPQMPLGTLSANLVAAYVVGVGMAAFAGMPQLSPQWRLFIITGFCGGLSTFSTFSAEVVALLMHQRYVLALGTAALHLFGSLLLTALGLYTYRLLRFGA